MAFANDFDQAAEWGLKMALAEDALKELPPAVRRMVYVAFLAVGMTGGYFTFVAGPQADAKDAISKNKADIVTLQQDVAGMKSDINTVKNNQARNDQKLDDVKDSMDAINQKLDRLLMRGQHAGDP